MRFGFVWFRVWVQCSEIWGSVGVKSELVIVLPLTVARILAPNSTKGLEACENGP